jgi:hypothetical protein
MHTMPLRVDGDTLHVVVSSSLWASELSLLQAPILTKLRNLLPHVSLLRFRVGKLEIPTDTAPPTRVQWASLPPELTEKLNGISDEGLRNAIQEAAAYSLGRSQTVSEGKSGTLSQELSTPPSLEKARHEPF